MEGGGNWSVLHSVRLCEAWLTNECIKTLQRNSSDSQVFAVWGTTQIQNESLWTWAPHALNYTLLIPGLDTVFVEQISSAHRRKYFIFCDVYRTNEGWKKLQFYQFLIMGPPNRLHQLHNGILSIAMILSTDDVSCVCVNRCRSDTTGSRQRTMMQRTRFKDGQGHVSDTR